ncbi:MAG TPA: hypothetical protein VND21_07240 [Planctomycetota bacterium]|nr:hypothetical protein [Planctomycetota bacterium]
MIRGRAALRRALPRTAVRALVALALAAALAACGDAPTPPATPPTPAPPKLLPADGTVEFTQVLVGYRVQGRTPFQRSKSEALTRAQMVLTRAQAGEPMENLVRELTDDRNDAGDVFNRGSYTIAKSDRRVVRVLREAILDTPVGALHHRPVDTGLAFVVFRRDR